MSILSWPQCVNALRPTQNGRQFPDNIFKYILLNENVWILIEISLNYVHKSPINNKPALVQIMAWCRPGDKPFSELMMVRLLTHICVTRPQCVNASNTATKILWYSQVTIMAADAMLSTYSLLISTLTKMTSTLQMIVSRRLSWIKIHINFDSFGSQYCSFGPHQWLCKLSLYGCLIARLEHG